MRAWVAPVPTSARSFQHPELGFVMIPLADTINHDDTSCVEWEMSTEVLEPDDITYTVTTDGACSFKQVRGGTGCAGPVCVQA